MRAVIRRVRVATLMATLAHLVIQSQSVRMSSNTIDVSGLVPKAILIFALSLMTSVVSGAVHAFSLRRRPDVSVTMCLLDGATIGLLSNLASQFISGGALFAWALLTAQDKMGPTLWAYYLFSMSVGPLISGFGGLILGGAGAGLVGLVGIRRGGERSPKPSAAAGD